MAAACSDCKNMLERITALELLVAHREMTRVREQHVIGRSGQLRTSLLGIERYSDIHKTSSQIVQEMALPISTLHKQLDDKNNAEFAKWKCPLPNLHDWLLQRANISADRLPALISLLDQQWITDVPSLLHSTLMHGGTLGTAIPANAFAAISQAAFNERHLDGPRHQPATASTSASSAAEM
jgi:hypothetical protein